MKEKPNYTEDAVSIAIASQLALLSFPFFKYSIVPISRGRERWLGADARLLARKRFLPFYMQFKRPFAHTVPSRANIIKDRNRLSPKLSTAPRTLYFPLQDKRKNHNDFQHNILYRLRKKLIARGIGDAAYVCPLFLDRKTYFFHSHIAGLFKWMRHWPSRPWDYQAVPVATLTGKTVMFPALPLLSEHISIPPHATVTTAAHKYSFTEQGSEICFHSPKHLPEGGFLFSHWLGNLISSIDNENALIHFSDSRGQLQQLVSETLGESGRVFELPIEGIQAWFVWGDYLERNYAIEQYGIVVD
ncbi:hypothetical protein ABRP92_16040 [Pectobacterium aroidearum]|uniref:hypothetical protein n=1 Tax=Pectobacterium aroidearum TaxID=1201031 RepID=UPI0032EDF0FB